MYEAVKPVPPDTELLVYYLPERPEELFFVRMRTSLYRQTMDSILEGKRRVIRIMEKKMCFIKLTSYNKGYFIKGYSIWPPFL